MLSIYWISSAIIDRMYKTSVGDCRGVLPLAITKNVLLNSSASGFFYCWWVLFKHQQNNELVVYFLIIYLSPQNILRWFDTNWRTIAFVFLNNDGIERKEIEMKRMPNMDSVPKILWKINLDPQILKITQFIEFRSL
jgi:hypothetical protein